MHLSLWALSPNSSNILLVFIRVFLIVFLIVIIITQWFSDSFPLKLFKSYAEKPWSLIWWDCETCYVTRFDEIVKNPFWISRFGKKPTLVPSLIESNQTIRFDKLTNRTFSHFFNFFKSSFQFFSRILTTLQVVKIFW